MPIYQKIDTKYSQIYLWKYDESDEFSHSELIKNDEKVKTYHPKKLLEYLMVRQMLKMAKPEAEILYEDNGQPILSIGEVNISISHSFPYASLAISKKKIGIDLEKIQSKILKIKYKFLNEKELSWVENSPNEKELLTIIWAIKEALYKLHSSKYWSLKKHYEVCFFNLDDLSEISCKVFDENFTDKFTAKVNRVEEYFFAIVEGEHYINYRF